MKQSIVILSLLLCLICAVVAKGGLSHKIRKSHRVVLATQEGSDAEAEEPASLLNPLHGRSIAEESSVEEEEPVVLDVRINTLREDNIEEGGNMDYTELCKLKNGYVNWVTDYQPPSEEHPNMNANDLPILSIKRVFAVLNKQTLSIFENSNVNSLIKTISISQIGSNMRPRRWAKAHCFQVMSRNAHEDDGNIKAWVDVDEPQDGALEAFCFNTEQKSVDWMEAIRNFQDCDVEVVEVPKNVQDEIDTVKQEEEDKINKIKNDLKSDCSKQNDAHEVELQEDEDIEGQLKIIAQQLKKESAEETKKRLQMTEEAKKIEEQTSKLEKERECLEEMLRRREQVEREISEQQISKNIFEHEETLLQKAAKVVISVKRQESKKIQKQHEIYIKEQQKKQETIKQNMVETTIQAERNDDYSVCTSVTDENKKQVFQEQCSSSLVADKAACATNSGFCISCCSQYVGLNFMSTRTECVTTCEAAIKITAADEDQNCDEIDLDQTAEDVLGDDNEADEGTIDEAVAEEAAEEPADEAEEVEVPEETVEETRNHRKLNRLRRRLFRLRK